MNMMAWLMLVLIAGMISVGITLSLIWVVRTERVLSQPIWQVLHKGGVNGRSDDGPDERNSGGKEDLEDPTTL